MIGSRRGCFCCPTPFFCWILFCQKVIFRLFRLHASKDKRGTSQFTFVPVAAKTQSVVSSSIFLQRHPAEVAGVATPCSSRQFICSDAEFELQWPFDLLFRLRYILLYFGSFCGSSFIYHCFYVKLNWIEFASIPQQDTDYGRKKGEMFHILQTPRSFSVGN